MIYVALATLAGVGYEVAIIKELICRLSTRLSWHVLA